MYEENRRFNWAGLFIKIIIVVIFILFTVWLLSLSNKGLSTSLSVLTDNVFSANLEKMKEVGKSYFTTERLPQKVGEVNTLTLDRMYDKKLLLPLKDKNGKTCSADNSYVSIQKMDTEYQMKVYLECPDKTDYIVVIMGCYKYCDSDICEKQESSALEYQYKKTVGGSWTNWSNWSDWSKTSVTKNNSRDVETKVVKEDYTYEKDVTETKVAGNATCSTVSGYTLISNKNGVCTYSKTTDDKKSPICPSVSGYTLTEREGFNCSYKSNTPNYKNPTCPNVSGYVLSERDGFTCSYDLDDDVVNPTCPSVSGYTVTGRSGFTCSYTKNNSPTVNPTCPSVSGYSYTGRSGFTCNYSKTTSASTNPTCPSVTGYSNTGRSGFTCSYSKTTSASTNPICPSVTGYSNTGRSGFTCSYSRSVKSSDYTLEYYSTGSGSYVPADNDTYHYVQTSADYIYKCNNTCSFQWYYTYKIYKKVYKTTTETITRSAQCPSGYSQSGNTCIGAGTTTTITRSAQCPSGYSQSGNTCVGAGTTTTTTRSAQCPSGYVQNGNTCIVSDLNTTRSAQCPSGYTRSGSVCVSNDDATIVRNASCPSGYSKSGNRCANYSTTTKSAQCPSGYTQSGSTCVKTTTDKITKNAVCKAKQTMKDGKCYETVTTKKKVTEKRDVTYYRFRTRNYTGGTIDYKWSTSNSDKSLFNSGYTLTGKTREVTL